MNKQVLIIDDEPLVLELFSDVLSDAGYTVGVAETAIEGLERLTSEHWDALISDVCLIPFDGFALAEYARKRWPGIGIVLVSGRADSDNCGKAQRMGLELLAKPVPMPLLVDCVGRLARDHFFSRQAAAQSLIANGLLGQEMRYQPR